LFLPEKGRTAALRNVTYFKWEPDTGKCPI